jgi:hypothetical protein
MAVVFSHRVCNDPVEPHDKYETADKKWQVVLQSPHVFLHTERPRSPSRRLRRVVVERFVGAFHFRLS